MCGSKTAASLSSLIQTAMPSLIPMSFFILYNRKASKPRGVSERITKVDILRKYGATLE
jgi:hypothetical protein